MSDAPNPARQILVIEDTAPVAFLLQFLLTGRGYVVELAEDGEKGLEKVSLNIPDLIILDLMLPGMHGMEVLKRLKSDPVTRGVGVMMCTARKYKPDLDQALELGAFDVMHKPFEKEELFEMVERFFAKSPKIKMPEMPAREAARQAAPTNVDRCFFRCWGTRGSIPVSGAEYARYGGNTSCVEIGHQEELLIIDAGSGLRQLGVKLARRGPRKLHILITHTHWDHIQGFPFFEPAYIPGFELVIYGATGFRADLKSLFTGQLNRDYFPVQFEDMRAQIEFRHLDQQQLDLEGFRVSWEYTHHPAATVGFKVEFGTKSLAYVSDNEFLYGYQGSPNDIRESSEELIHHRRLVEFVRGVDVLIHEGQYTEDEYRTKVGWGHSSIANACVLARLAEVKSWVVTHHDPRHDDEFLDRKLNRTKDLLRELGVGTPVVHAYDGLMDYL